jgi:hypothetical protein
MAIEDGSSMPRTSLGKRAAIEQAFQMALIDAADPDQRYALLSHFGLSDLVPTLNIHVQAALQIQDAFEKWAQNPQGPPPLVVKPWHDVQIHWSERIKWLNTDKMREMMVADPMIEQVINMHLAELQFNMISAAPQVGPSKVVRVRVAHRQWVTPTPKVVPPTRSPQVTKPRQVNRPSKPGRLAQTPRTAALSAVHPLSSV